MGYLRREAANCVCARERVRVMVVERERESEKTFVSVGERKRTSYKTTHSSLDLILRGRRIAGLRKPLLSAGCICLSALRRVVLD